jgi:hypothetical protein
MNPTDETDLDRYGVRTVDPASAPDRRLGSPAGIDCGAILLVALGWVAAIAILGLAVAA